MTAASGPRTLAPGRGRLSDVKKEGENLPRKSASLPLGLGSLELEFGGLHIGVLGHGRGKRREPEQERATEAQKFPENVCSTREGASPCGPWPFFTPMSHSSILAWRIP